MVRTAPKGAIALAAERLRALVLDNEDGALLGNEESLTALLGCSRNTIRQVARLLEREGLLEVRRGTNGGYFGARPDARTVEAAVSAYLLAREVDAVDMTAVGAALYIEASRKAARADRAELDPFVARWRERIRAVKDSATFNEVRSLEVDHQREVMDLTRSTYMRLVFDLNLTFSRRLYGHARPDNTSELHRRFVREWREAKLMELNAIGLGDPELAALAATCSRKVWHRRVMYRYGPMRQREAFGDAGNLF